MRGVAPEEHEEHEDQEGKPVVSSGKNLRACFLNKRREGQLGQEKCQRGGDPQVPSEKGFMPVTGQKHTDFLKNF